MSTPGDGPEPEATTSPRADERPDWARLHLWQIAALRDLGLVASIYAVFWLLFYLRAVTVPIATALILAALFHPVVTNAEKKLGIPRVITTSWIVFLLLVGGIALGLVGIPQIAASVVALIEQVPRYLQSIADLAGLDKHLFDAEKIQKAIQDAMPHNLSELAAATPFLEQVQGIVGFLLGFLAQFGYVVIATAFTLVLFAFAVVRFDHLPDIRSYLPRSQRDEIWTVLQKIAEVFVAFVRGQILVAIFTTAGFAVGFAILGVPYGIVAALIGGVLSFIPNGQVSGWLLAMAFVALEADPAARFPWFSVFLYPTIVYGITQSLETFVITPLVQGQYTKMHPLAVLAAIIGGASVGGLLGILLAIPIAASAWIAWQELVSPALVKLADER